MVLVFLMSSTGFLASTMRSAHFPTWSVPIFRLEEFCAALGGGHDDLHWSQTGLDHLFQFDMVEIPLESSRHSGVCAHAVSDAPSASAFRFSRRSRVIEGIG